MGEKVNHPKNGGVSRKESKKQKTHVTGETLELV